MNSTPQRGKITSLDIVDRKNSRQLPTLSPGELKSRTQRAAYTLLEREEKNAKKSRLESLLLHQFLAKYGTKTPNSSINSFIKAAIRDFIDTYVNAHDAEPHIPELEKTIASESNEQREEMKTEKKKLAKLEEERQKKLFQMQQQQQQSMQQQSMDPSVRNKQVFEDLTHKNPLLLVNMVQLVNEEEKQRKEQALTQQKKEQFKTALDEQLAYHKSLQEQNQQLKLKQNKKFN